MSTLVDYAPIPRSALGPALNELRRDLAPSSLRRDGIRR
jgi:hypothetical protein